MHGVMRGRTCLLLLLVLSGACGPHVQAPEPIAGVPPNQQRVITRSELGWRWPFTVGTGTLGCVAGAVVFRNAGVDYAVNGPAKSRGSASLESIRLTYSEWPTDPLSRIPQDVRETIFAETARCGAATPADAADRCRQRVRESRAVSEAELKQIEVEGRERTWPPLPPAYATLDPVIEAGLKLCRP